MYSATGAAAAAAAAAAGTVGTERAGVDFIVILVEKRGHYHLDGINKKISIFRGEKSCGSIQFFLYRQEKLFEESIFSQEKLFEESIF